MCIKVSLLSTIMALQSNIFRLQKVHQLTTAAPSGEVIEVQYTKTHFKRPHSKTLRNKLAHFSF